jgi:hypothetical protein
MDGNTRKQRLIDDKGAQLKERPAVEYRALLPASPHPRTYAPQIFQGDSTLCAFGSRYKLFADNVVDIPRKAGFLSCESFEAAGAFRAFLLEPVPEPPMAVAHAFDDAPAVDRAVAIGGDVCHPKIDAQRVIYVLRIGFINIAGSEQIPVIADEGQIGFAVARHKQLPLPLTAYERDRLPSIHRPDRDRRTLEVIREDAIIVGNRRHWSKGALGVRIQFIGVCDFGNTPYHHLGAKIKDVAHSGIAALLQRELAKGAGFPRNRADVVTGSIRPLDRASERICLCGSRLQLQLCRKFHIVNASRYRTFVQAASAAFLPGLKHLGFLRRFRVNRGSYWR